MKLMLTRVKSASVVTSGALRASIDRGIVAFIGLEKSDQESALIEMASKVATLRIFENEAGKLDSSAKDRGYPVLCVPNFTLCACTKKGRRPSFDQAMIPIEAVKLFEAFTDLLRSEGLRVEKGVFGEHMDIELVLDGPVNIILDTK